MWYDFEEFVEGKTALARLSVYEELSASELADVFRLWICIKFGAILVN